MFNLENVINPVHGLTQTPFNDPYKRVDWLSTTVDNLNQMTSGALMAPVNWAVALHLYQQGQQDAANRWMGQLFPQGSVVKAGLTMAQEGVNQIAPGSALSKPINAGQFIQNNQLDPFTNFLDGGLTPYERDQVGTALAQMVTNGTITQEQAVDAAHSQTGPVWQQASVMASQTTAPATVAGFFMGLGTKPRSTQDVINNQMNSDIGQLIAMQPNMSPQAYKQAWQQMSQKYPSMEEVLLSHKGGTQRDATYAYDVLSRIPPGDTFNLLTAAGLTTDDINHFYGTKGFTTPGGYTDSKGVIHPPMPFTPQQESKFMSAIADLGAMLKMPDVPTTQEWNTAKNNYQSISDQIDKRIPGIWQEVQAYNDIKYSGQTGADTQASQFLSLHPEISQAQALREQAILADPVLSKYYGGIKTLTLYWTNSDHNFLLAKYGKDIYQKEYAYYNENLTPASRRLYIAQHPELKGFFKDNRTLSDQAQLAINKFSQYLPEPPKNNPRSDFTAQNQQQQNEATALQGVQTPTIQQLTAGMSVPLTNQLMAYAQGGTRPTPMAMTELNYIASRRGYYNGEAMLNAAVQSYNDYVNSQNQLVGQGQ